MNKTKIIATIGPSSDHPQIISKLILSGMNVARINMAHCKDEGFLKKIISVIRSEADKLNTHVGILIDLAGPKIRLDLHESTDEIKVVKDHIYQLGFSKMNDLPINVDLTFKNIYKQNSFVKIDDGKIEFKVIKTDGKSIKIKALENGVLKNNKGVNFPGIDIDVPCLTEKDINDIKLAIKYDADWLALSFVRSASDINYILEVLNDSNSVIPIIAKIEKPEAIDDLDNIILKFDGILVARGDLGVEMPLSKLPALQKSIIEKCRLEKKPVIIATQMLESMINSNQPTRAEVTDVANAVYQGSDAVMLSEETAMGTYPIETVSIMREIVVSAEQENSKHYSSNVINNINDNRNAIGNAIIAINESIDIDAIVVMTESGSTATVVSQFRPNANLFAMTPHKKVCQRLTLVWGIVSLVTPKFLSTDDMLISAEKILKNNKYICKDDIFILTSGVPVGVVGSTNMLKIQKVTD